MHCPTNEADIEVQQVSPWRRQSAAAAAAGMMGFY